MKKTFLSIALALMAITIVKADEGMWLLKELNRQSVERMKELGFTSQSIACTMKATHR